MQQIMPIVALCLVVSKLNKFISCITFQLVEIFFTQYVRILKAKLTHAPGVQGWAWVALILTNFRKKFFKQADGPHLNVTLEVERSNWITPIIFVQKIIYKLNKNNFIINNKYINPLIKYWWKYILLTAIFFNVWTHTSCCVVGSDAM